LRTCKNQAALILCLLLICSLLNPIKLAYAADEQEGLTETVYVLLDKPKQIKKIDSILIKNQINVKKIQEIGFLQLKGNIGQLNSCLQDISAAVDASWYKEPIESSEAKLFHNKISWDLHGIEELNEYLWYAESQTNNYETYKIQEGNPEVKIALLDSGVDLSNENFGQTIVTANSWNYVDGNNNVQDQNGHGTQVAGIMNLLAPEISIVPYKIMNNNGGNSFDLLSAVVQATNDKNQVINISAGSYIQLDEAGYILQEAYQRAIDYADKNQVIVVASAGNRGSNADYDNASNEIHVPSMLENVISVGAVTKSNRLAPYSNYGPYIDYVAYGGYFGDNFDTAGEINVTDLMLTAFPGQLPNTPLDSILNIPQGYSLSYGTSLAAPQVSATAALLISNYYDKHHKFPKSDKILNLLEKSVVDLGDPGRDDQYGYGQILVNKALVKKNTKTEGE
jgi:lantibiotic leader peptide-processing serine protease